MNFVLNQTNSHLSQCKLRIIISTEVDREPLILFSTGSKHSQYVPSSLHLDTLKDGVFLLLDKRWMIISAQYPYT